MHYYSHRLIAMTRACLNQPALVALMSRCMAGLNPKILLLCVQAWPPASTSMRRWLSRSCTWALALWRLVSAAPVHALAPAHAACHGHGPERGFFLPCPRSHVPLPLPGARALTHMQAGRQAWHSLVRLMLNHWHMSSGTRTKQAKARRGRLRRPTCVHMCMGPRTPDKIWSGAARRLRHA